MPQPYKLTAAVAVAYARRRVGASARQASIAAGLSESYVGKVEAGEITPSLRAFAHMARALEITDAEIALVVRAEADEPLHAAEPNRQTTGQALSVTPPEHTGDVDEMAS